MVTEFLGPSYPRRDSVGATLNALRTRLETDTANFDSKRDILSWQVREAIRTEFFKIIYPAPPSPHLLSLVTRTEILLTDYTSTTRPFFFPGARVAVPTEAGSRRAGTTLQLRFKVVNNATVTEALLHLDGPNGGGFQWVQTPALTPLLPYHPGPRRAITKPLRTTPPARRGKPRVPRPRPPKQTRPPRTRPPRPQQPRRVKPVVKPPVPEKKLPPPRPTPPQGPAALPPTYIPPALRSASPPPRKRLRHNITHPISHASGALHKTFGVQQASLSASAAAIRNILAIERILARRSVKNTVEYFVKWAGRPIRDGSWEIREALLEDVPGIVLEFDTKHPNPPKVVYRSDRPRTEAEREKEYTVKDTNVVSKKGTVIQTTDETIVGESQSPVKEEATAVASVSTPNTTTTSASAVPSPTTTPDPATPSSTTQQTALPSTAPSTGTNPVLTDTVATSTPQSAHPTKTYIDDVSGVEIPFWLDTPIVEIPFAGMILQVRRPDSYAIHNDAASVIRDTRKRQIRFKQENLQAAEKIFPLVKSEAKQLIESTVRSQKAMGKTLIMFPRGLGHVSPGDHGSPFGKTEVTNAPMSWESYMYALGCVPNDYSRELPPHMPLISKEDQLLGVKNRLYKHETLVHRERARSIVREGWRNTGGAPPPSIFPGGVRRTVYEDCKTPLCGPGSGTVLATSLENTRDGIDEDAAQVSTSTSNTRVAAVNDETPSKAEAVKKAQEKPDTKAEDSVRKQSNDLLRDRDSQFAAALAEASTALEAYSASIDDAVGAATTGKKRGGRRARGRGRGGRSRVRGGAKGGETEYGATGTNTGGTKIENGGGIVDVTKWYDAHWSCWRFQVEKKI